MADYPDWVMKHKKKGTYINKVGDKYYLYAAHSERIIGTDKIRRVCDGYLGRITEQEGLIPPKDKVVSPILTYEFGFSFAIYSCTSQILCGLRRTFTKYGDLVYVCAVLSFIYGMYDRELFESSYLHLRFDSVLYPDMFTSAQVSGIERGCRMITDTVNEYFGDDLPLIKAYFSNIHLVKINHKLYVSEFPAQTNALSEKYSIDWSNALWQK